MLNYLTVKVTFYYSKLHVFYVSTYTNTTAKHFVLLLLWEYLGIDTAVRQSQVGAVLVTDGAHDDVSGLADFFAGKQH